ncbi:MAG: DUF4249 domain-containing protein [Chitinophagaceae bacterium]
MEKRYLLQLAFIILLASGCKEKYEPPVIQTDVSALVVDGFLNASSDTTFIRLSHTQKLSEGVNNSQELGAQMSVEDANGNTLYNFQQLNDSGIYIVPGMSLDINAKYRLRITRPNGKQYESDEIPVVKTPPIDSISYGKANNQMFVYANTHDPNNNTWYYRWAYTETYQYTAAYFASLIFQNGGITDRQPKDYIYECWKTQQSTQLLLATSTKLAQDIIYQFPLRNSDVNGIEFSQKYFINVRQYALTKEAFEYLVNLKRITEQTGSLFDAQPSQLNGNIHAINDPNESVLGYITAATQEVKERYITNADVQPWNYDPRCSVIEIPIDMVAGAFSENGLIPLSWDGSPLMPKGVFATTHECGDCRAFGGVTTKPDFFQ